MTSNTNPFFSNQSIPTLQSSTSKSPLFRFFDRESQLGTQLLSTIRSDLASLILVCDGSLKQTNHLRNLLSSLAKGVVPTSWLRYKSRSMVVSSWILDFNKRLIQLDRIVSSGLNEGTEMRTDLGLLFNAGGFITASRQSIAHATKCSLETLELHVMLEEVGAEGSFTVEGKHIFLSSSNLRKQLELILFFPLSFLIQVSP